MCILCASAEGSAGLSPGDPQGSAINAPMLDFSHFHCTFLSLTWLPGISSQIKNLHYVLPQSLFSGEPKLGHLFSLQFPVMGCLMLTNSIHSRLYPSHRMPGLQHSVPHGGERQCPDNQSPCSLSSNRLPKERGGKGGVWCADGKGAEQIRFESLTKWEDHQSSQIWMQQFWLGVYNCLMQKLWI